MRYYLPNGTATDDLDLWSKELADHKRIDRTRVEPWSVSTVFLGIDHGWDDGPPLLYETMVFGPHVDQYCERYSTEDEAREGHDRIVGWLRREGWKFRLAGAVRDRLARAGNRIGRWIAGEVWHPDDEF